MRLRTAVATGRAEVYTALTDASQLVGLVDGLVSLHPVGTKGNAGGRPYEGAEFSAVMRLGPAQVHSRLVLARLVPGETVEWVSKDDDDRALSFTLADGDVPGVTRVLLAVTYELPPGVKGVLARPVVEQAVRSHARRTLLNMKERFGVA